MPSDEAARSRPAAQRFPPEERVCLRRDYERAYRSGVRSGGRHFVLHAAPNGLGHPRLGMAVSRKVGGAVVRNRLRRRIRSVYRAHRERFPRGTDIVVGARPGAAGASFREIEEDILAALSRLGSSPRPRERRGG